jgi:hypothetical protein
MLINGSTDQRTTLFSTDKGLYAQGQNPCTMFEREIYETLRTDDISSAVGLPTLQRTNAENSKQIFPEKELRSRSSNIHIHVSVSDLYIP